MSDATINQIIKVIEWLAMPLVYFILLLLFLFVFVKPFFAYLFDPKRVHLSNALDKQQKSTFSQQRLNELVEGDDLIIDPEHDDIPDILTDEEKIARLSQADPERAGQLIKQWLNHDPDQKGQQ